VNAWGARICLGLAHSNLWKTLHWSGLAHLIISAGGLKKCWFPCAPYVSQNFVLCSDFKITTSENECFLHVWILYKQIIEFWEIKGEEKILKNIHLKYIWKIHLICSNNIKKKLSYLSNYQWVYRRIRSSNHSRLV
jgi:hypothetical protein